MRWMVRGDIDGFFGLAIDNLIQLLLIDVLCRVVLGFPEDLVYGRILPATAVSLLVGNLYYAREAMRIGRAEGRSNACALPYGINTVSLFAYALLVMLPAKLMAESAGMADPSRFAWQMGLLACLGSGIIELGGAFVAERVRRATPRAALLSTLAGIALGFISLAFVFRTFASPLIGLTTLAIIMLTYFGKVRFRGGLPGGLIAVAVGALLAWMTGLAPVGARPEGAVTLLFPVPVLGDLTEALSGGQWLAYLSVIVPMGLFNVIGSLQNIESAEAAGDRYRTTPALAVNGLGTIAGALFGSCFPTTIYIGHPGWKALGARAGYSILNGAFITLICLTGTLAYITWAVPIEAGMAIVLWIGIVISAQAFEATPRAHAPAVVVGILPGIGAWGALMAKNGLRAAGYGAPDGPEFSPDLIDAFLASDTYIDGAFAIEQGFIFTAMILAAVTVAVIERRFQVAAAWCGAAAVLSTAGLMHSYTWTPSDTALTLTPAWPFSAAYLLMGACFLSARWLGETAPPVSGVHSEREKIAPKPPVNV